VAATGPEHSEVSADELAELATLLARAAVEEKAALRATQQQRRKPNGHSKRATFQSWLREHAPLAYLGLYAGNDEVARATEYRRRRELWELARVRRDALAYCIECRNPLVATEQGFQFCPYQRAGQHEKLRRALFEETPVAAVVTLDRDAARWRRRGRQVGPALPEPQPPVTLPSARSPGHRKFALGAL
jgi:hypothetical protein